MSVLVYKKTALTGGTSDALDGIDGAELNDGDICWVYLTDGEGDEYVSEYRLDSDSGESESSPNIIAPDDNPGSKRWILQATKYSGRGFILGGEVVGRVLRVSKILIQPGTDPNTCKCEVTNIWNGDSAATQDNIEKGGSETNFTLSADGTIVGFRDAAITGTVQGVAGSVIQSDTSGLSINSCDAFAGGGNISFRFGDGSIWVDLTGIASALRVSFTYITDE